MATTNRASLLTKIHKVLKKHYEPHPVVSRSLLEDLLFASCLENAHYDAAERAYKTLVETLFDWNEVRVSTVKELGEVLHMLAEPEAAADRIKRILWWVFEKHYSFDLEECRKQKLGKAVEYLEKINGTTPFSVAYVTQSVLGGHAIPLSRGTLDALVVIGALTDGEVEKGSFGFIERAIPKNKGQEFGSLLHQLGADFFANPHSTNLHKILLEIAPDAKGRLPKRQTAKAKVEPAPASVKNAKGAKKGAEPVGTKRSDAPQPATDGRQRDDGGKKAKKPEPKAVEKKAKPPAKKPAEPKRKKTASSKKAR